MKAQLLIPAAGLGSRLGTQGPKALVALGGEPMLVRALSRCRGLGLGSDVLVAAPAGYAAAFQELARSVAADWALHVVAGGAARQDSVANMLDVVSEDTQVVVVHDAARPFVPPAAVSESMEAAAAFGAATVAVPCSDTILEGDEAGFLMETPDRERLWACQTPQSFRVDVLRRAHAHARREGFAGTDDATLARRAGFPVKLVKGSRTNIKITTPEDLILAEALARMELP